ncbi:hypothetical protein [Kitasatospora sp. NPDC101183]|uniref:hypothetical protein n=1 Tax=Kitasatospora sp. NPDC101183 TaxID=3364100 RepID=UPI00381A808F
MGRSRGKSQGKPKGQWGAGVALAALVLALVVSYVAGKEYLLEWVHTPKAVTATLTDCRWSDEEDHYSCVYTWTLDGRERSHRWVSDDYREDGYREGLWASPRTDQLSHHNPLFLGVLALVFVPCALVFLYLGWFQRPNPRSGDAPARA